MITVAFVPMVLKSCVLVMWFLSLVYMSPPPPAPKSPLCNSKLPPSPPSLFCVLQNFFFSFSNQHTDLAKVRSSHDSGVCVCVCVCACARVHTFHVYACLSFLLPVISPKDVVQSLQYLEHRSAMCNAITIKFAKFII